ncbi:MAG: pyridoxine 5'-phosphate synthase [Deltaproteobacteria bacterium]|nr:MAG: pyridoxine 5'-phosphate synthase [Deltaproteobacteria bacterium]
MAELAVNVDHVATVRQARGTTRYPDPVAAAALAEFAGADGIVVHLRQDRRHIQDMDLIRVRQSLQTRLTLEMGATREMLDIALSVKPDTVTLVPERREEVTTEGGLDLLTHGDVARDAVAALSEADITTCIFIDPDPAQVAAAHALGADMVELHTGAYCEAPDVHTRETEILRLQAAVSTGRTAGLVVNAGHGLDYHNIKVFSRIPGIHEFSIGHSIISRAIMTGMQQAVADMRALVRPL